MTVFFLRIGEHFTNNKIDKLTLDTNMMGSDYSDLIGIYPGVQGGYVWAFGVFMEISEHELIQAIKSFHVER